MEADGTGETGVESKGKERTGGAEKMTIVRKTGVSRGTAQTSTRPSNENAGKTCNVTVLN